MNQEGRIKGVALEGRTIRRVVLDMSELSNRTVSDKGKKGYRGSPTSTLVRIP